MKKIIIALFFLASTFGFSANAQQKMSSKKSAKMSTSKDSSMVTKKTGMKKDGTPDMRLKANKMASKPAGPLKKNGTADMRYKANKQSKTATTAPVK